MKKLATFALLATASVALSACVELDAHWQNFIDYANYQTDHGTPYMHAMGEDSGSVLTVYFGFNSTDLTDQASADLKILASNVAAQGNVGMIITGHSDTSGNAAYNKDLSQRRANAVRDALIAAGVSADSARVDVYADGESSLAILTEDGIAEAANRRVTIEAVVVGDDG